MLSKRKTHSAPEPRISWQQNAVLAIGRVHIVAASLADDDKLSAMTIRSHPTIFNLQLLQQTAVLARPEGLLIGSSAAVLFAAQGH